MDLFSLFLLTYENNEIKSPTKIYDFTVLCIYTNTCITYRNTGSHKAKKKDKNIKYLKWSDKNKKGDV